MSQASLGIVVGFAAEARIARGLGWPVAIGGGSTAGAAEQAKRLIDAGATGLVSFGLAGGLDPELRAGTLIVAKAVMANDHIRSTDPALGARLGGMTHNVCLGRDRIVASSAEKRQLARETGAASVDMESGAVAEIASEAGIPFAILRAICDPANLDLPPAAMVALDPAGGVAFGRLARSIIGHPGQIRALIGLARDAEAARRALRSRVAAIRSAMTRG